jgi:2-amino-4-hydroxy-6-hydroxymethyldihydropteridine diphosphokinase
MKAGEGFALIALGSNLGDSKQIIREAFQELAELSTRPIVRSSLWQSSPVDCPPGSPAFVNAGVVLFLKAHETPETLLAKLQTLEKKFGRQEKKVHNEARPLDLDLVAFGGETRQSPNLTLPHPRAHQRKFVLLPLAEIAPEFVLPGLNRSIRELLAELRSEEQVSRLDQ